MTVECDSPVADLSRQRNRRGRGGGRAWCRTLDRCRWQAETAERYQERLVGPSQVIVPGVRLSSERLPAPQAFAGIGLQVENVHNRVPEDRGSRLGGLLSGGRLRQ